MAAFSVSRHRIGLLFDAHCGVRVANTQRARALELLSIRSMMRLKDFAAHGIGPETLARLVRVGGGRAPCEGSLSTGGRTG